MAPHDRLLSARRAQAATRRPAVLCATARKPLALLALALLAALACAGCGGGGGTAIVTRAPAAVALPPQAAGPVGGLNEIARQLRDGAERTARAAGQLEAQARRYAALEQTARTERRRERALGALQASLARVQAAHDPLAAFVEALPALAGEELGVDTVSANARPDDSAQPLTQLVALLHPGAEGVAARAAGGAVSLPAGSTLLAAARALHRRAVGLAAGVAAAQPTAATTRAAIATGLQALQDYGSTASGAAAELAPEVTRARATLAGLLAAVGAVHGDSTAATALSSLAPGLRFLGELLAIAATPQGGEAQTLLAQEIQWRATDLAAAAQRGDGAPGPQAAAAQKLDEALLDARLALAHGQRQAAAAALARARLALSGALAPAAALAGGERLLAQAASAARRGNAEALAAAAGRTLAGLTTAAYRLTLSDTQAHRAAAAAGWAAVRDFGPSAPGAIGGDALQAVQALGAGKLTAAQAALVVRRDELDQLQRRTVALVGAATLASDQGHLPGARQAAALADGYWELLAPIYRERLGAAAAATATAAFARLAGTQSPATSRAASGAANGASPVAASTRLSSYEASTAASAALGAFTAAPATGVEQEQRVRQLVEAMRFTVARLCGANPTAAPGIGLPGTVAGPPLVARLVNDLRPSLSGAQRATLAGSVRALAALPGAVGVSGEETPPPSTAQPSASIRAHCAQAGAGVRAVFPGAWGRIDDDGDFNRIEAQLARAEAAAAGGGWAAAEADARGAYAIFDLTPELRLRAVAPELATRIEALFWNGGDSGGALFEALAKHASASAVHTRRAALEQALLQAHAVLDSAHSSTAVLVNSAIVVFREGLEALLIVAALGASFVTTGARWRRPIVAGALAAVPATVLTWLLAGAVLGSFVGYGLQLQAVLDVLALAVLAVMLAWFFQKFCWTRFVAREHARHRRLLSRAQTSGGLGPMLGLAAVGFTIVYREGFETVLFLQALRVEAGTGAVIEGVLLGGALTAAIAVLMLRLRRRLPYRRMVVATAALIGVLTVAMTGQAVRSLQLVGWLAITPVHVSLSEADGLWLGLYPTVQSLLAQLVAALAIVLGAVLSERLRTRRLERRVAAARAARAAKTAARTAQIDGATASTAGRPQARIGDCETDARNAVPTAFYR